MPASSWSMYSSLIGFPMEVGFPKSTADITTARLCSYVTKEKLVNGLVPFQLALVPSHSGEPLGPSGLAPIKLKVEA